MRRPAERSDLGDALRDLGKRTSNTALLEDALKAYRAGSGVDGPRAAEAAEGVNEVQAIIAADSDSGR